MNEKIVESGLGELRDRVGNLEKGLSENTATTKRIETDTSEMLELFKSAKGGFRMLEVMGSAFKWTVAVAASITALWLSLKGK